MALSGWFQNLGIGNISAYFSLWLNFITKTPLLFWSSYKGSSLA